MNYFIGRCSEGEKKALYRGKSKNPKAGIGIYSGMYKASQRKNQIRAESMEKERQKSLMWDSPKAKEKPKSIKSTKTKESKSMATRAQKNRATKLSNLRKKARMIGCVVKAKAGRGKSKNTRYYKKIAKGVYQYELRNR